MRYHEIIGNRPRGLRNLYSGKRSAPNCVPRYGSCADALTDYDTEAAAWKDSREYLYGKR